MLYDYNNETNNIKKRIASTGVHRVYCDGRKSGLKVYTDKRGVRIVCMVCTRVNRFQNTLVGIRGKHAVTFL